MQRMTNRTKILASPWRVALGRWIAALILALGATSLTSAGPLNDPATDPFYQPPSPLPAGDHGTLIRSRSFIPVGLLAWGWQILYKSTDTNGNPIAVSGTVLVPYAPWLFSPRPILGWAPGTMGNPDRCAPSHQLAVGTNYEAVVIPQALALNWAIAMTDYQGTGTPGDHTYGVGKPSGRAVLDAVIAAQQLPPAGLSPNAPVGLVGYSEGGFGAAWAAEEHPTYAPQLQVKGVAAGAGPHDVSAVYAAHATNGSAFSGATAAILIGLNAQYPELNLDGILTPYGKSVIADARNNKCFLEMVLNYPFLSDAAMVNYPSILSRADWVTRFAQQRTGTKAPTVPALVYAGLLDEAIAYANSKQTFDEWCKRGANARFVTVGITEHVTGLAVGFPIALTWMAERFAGVQASSTCP